MQLALWRGWVVIKTNISSKFKQTNKNFTRDSHLASVSVCYDVFADGYFWPWEWAKVPASADKLVYANALRVCGDDVGRKEVHSVAMRVETGLGGSFPDRSLWATVWSERSFWTGVWSERVFWSASEKSIGRLDRGVWINEVEIDYHLATNWDQEVWSCRWPEDGPFNGTPNGSHETPPRGALFAEATQGATWRTCPFSTGGYWCIQRDRYCNVCLVIVSLSGTACSGKIGRHTWCLYVSTGDPVHNV
jgi:hypothetical protein